MSDKDYGDLYTRAPLVVPLSVNDNVEEIFWTCECGSQSFNITPEGYKCEGCFTHS